MHLRDSIARVIGVVRGCVVLKGRLGSAIQRIVGIRRRLTLPIKDRREIAVVVVRVGFSIQERVFSGARPIHIAVRVDRLLRLRIGDSQEITVWIVAELGDPVDRSGQ